MAEFREQDLTGSRFEDVNLQGATFDRVNLDGAELRKVDLNDVTIHGAGFHRARLRGVELVDVEITGEVVNVVINGVDVGPLIDAELNRRMPERAKMHPTSVAGFREAWSILEGLWEGTIARARTFPEEALHRSVGGEWSFIQTLRHLNFASAAWVGRMIRGNASPWHPLDLPWDEAPGWDGIPWDREARPSLDVVLEVRAERQAMIREVLASLTEEQLASDVSHDRARLAVAGELPLQGVPLHRGDEEWQHRLYAERDLTLLAG